MWVWWSGQASCLGHQQGKKQGAFKRIEVKRLLQAVHTGW